MVTSLGIEGNTLYLGLQELDEKLEELDTVNNNVR
jgi:hypothetical protein